VGSPEGTPLEDSLLRHIMLVEFILFEFHFFISSQSFCTAPQIFCPPHHPTRLLKILANALSSV